MFEVCRNFHCNHTKVINSRRRVLSLCCLPNLSLFFPRLRPFMIARVCRNFRWDHMEVIRKVALELHRRRCTNKKVIVRVVLDRRRRRCNNTKRILRVALDRRRRRVVSLCYLANLFFSPAPAPL